MIILRLAPLLFIFSAFGASQIEKIFEKESSIKKPFEMRDPFQAPKLKTRQTKRRQEQKNGVLNNIPALGEDVNIDSITVVGLLISGSRRAIIRLGNNETGQTYTLKEGDKIGRSGTVLKAILPGGVILVEEITNVYGEPEFIETVIPISK